MPITKSEAYKQEAEMSKEKTVRNVLQPECKNCSRYAILKSPCSPEACIFREDNQKPGWYRGS